MLSSLVTSVFQLLTSTLTANVNRYYTYDETPAQETDNVLVEEDEDEDIEVSSSEDKPEKNSFNGKVTSYFNNRGLIDDHVYFTKGVLLGDEDTKVGDDVLVEATRSHSEGGWIATKVQIVYPWAIEPEDDDKPFKDFIVASVIEVLPKQITVKMGNLELRLDKKFLSVGYKPLRGDYVHIEIWRENDSSDISEDMIISVAPLREKKIHGKVTDILRGYGMINTDIYFQFCVCERGTRVNRGDEVVAMIMESKQMRGDWRATSVAYKKKERTNDVATTTPDTNKKSNKRNSDMHNISITENIDFGNILLKESREIQVNVVNVGKQRQTFVGVKHLPTAGLSINLGPDLKTVNQNLIQNGEKGGGWVQSVDMFSKGKILCPSMVLAPGESKVVPIKFQPEYLGKICISVDFSFYGFDISRTINASVIDDLQNAITNANAKPYEKKSNTFFGQKLNTNLSDRSVVPGQRPVRQRKVFLPNKLARYPIPSNIRQCVQNSSGDIELMVPELAQPLHVSNYKKKLSTLLYVEEIVQEMEMREFDLTAVLLRRQREFLSLDVPGLAEGRPSLLIGDTVIVSYTNRGSDSPTYEGYIHEVHAECVMLKFNETFQNSYANDDVDVEFHSNRTSIRREHQSIEHALQMFDIVFPTEIVAKAPLFQLENNEITPFNKLLNERQITAVSRIVAGCGRPVPYVLFGPPGTGKTVTVVESILQIFKNIKHSRVLVCAPSNSAADLIAERLHHSGILQKSDMIRLNAFQRSKLAMPEVIEPYCSKEEDDIRMLCRRRIVIATCNTAGSLYAVDLKVGHFTHVFVDEAGQATEPACLIPVGFAAGCDEAQIVLAGDPFQLGAVLRSDIAQDFGLNISFLERLMGNKLYERDEQLYGDCGNYNPLVVTKLINNYRSHPHLLKLSSTMFYNAELIPCADEHMVNLCIGCKELLPNVSSPFVFHGLRSEDQREGNSPSWFNAMEAVQVLKYVQTVLKTFKGKIELDDIGIITPYRKQVEKIRLLLAKFSLDDIKVGSVEEFQGQERMCVIISTVRSNESFVNFDTFHNIGFLSNPKRFNVSITRAQALLIIIGNPVVLCHDPHWCAMLQYAVMTGSYAGCDLPSLDSEVIQENFKKAAQLLGKCKE